MTPRGHCPVCHSRLGTSLTSCVCGWKMLDHMQRQNLELPPPVGFVLRAEHDRLIAEKDTEIARLVSERQRVDRRIKNQRAQLAWWNRLFSDHLAAACRRRIYYPNWTPVLYRRAKARRAIKGGDNG